MLGELEAAHARHNDVAEHDIEGPGAGQLQRLLARPRPRHNMAEVGQQCLGKGADFLIVLDDENRGGRLVGGRRRLRPRQRRIVRLATRQRQGHHRALGEIASNLDVAARLRNETIDLAEAESRSFSGRLGGEKWLEDAVERFGVHAVAGIGDLYRDHRVAAPRSHLAGADRQSPAAGHGVASVGGDVEDRRLKLGAVDFDGAA